MGGFGGRGGGGFGGGAGFGGDGGGRFGPSGHDYQFAGQPGTSGVDENKVNSLIAQRLQCKMSRDFDTADRIRDDLRAMGVNVDDQSKTWSAGGGGGGGFGAACVARSNADAWAWLHVHRRSSGDLLWGVGHWWGVVGQVAEEVAEEAGASAPPGTTTAATTTARRRWTRRRSTP
jgi:hypothetical protein